MTTATEGTTKKTGRSKKGAPSGADLTDASVDESSKAALGWEAAPMVPVDPVVDAPTPMTWNQAAAAADAAKAEQKANQWEWDTCEEVLDIKLTVGDMADLLRANGADEDVKAEVDRAIDSMKAELKEKKAESDAIAARMKDRNRSGGRGVQSKKAHWKVGTHFGLNTVRYLDPITDRVVFERALRADERQVELPLNVPVDVASKDAEQLSLGDVDPADMTDPDALLRAAQQGDGDPADVPLDNEPSLDDLGDEEHDEEDEVASQ